MKTKFRFWDKFNKYWSSDALYIDEDGTIWEIEERSRAYQTYMHRENVSERYERVQFTGLHDKNGNEIYAGDVCKFVINDEWDGKNPLETQTVVIELRNGAWGFVHTHPLLVHEDDREWRSFWQDETKEMWSATYFEVIGNIHEHPHLLKGGIPSANR